VRHLAPHFVHGTILDNFSKLAVKNFLMDCLPFCFDVMFTSLLYMPRRFRRYARSARTVKPIRYSNETVSGTTGGGLAAGATYHVIVVPGVPGPGVRKVKNPTLRLAMSQPNPAFPILWALVYVPEGFPDTALKLDYGVSDNPPSLFEPNQNLIMAGVMPATGAAEPITYRSRIARNLNSGDSIHLLVRGMSANVDIEEVRFIYVLNFAMCYG
jgi:hypothetical protein